MCKCFQSCLETCYWHLIEKRFCYDESIALYEDPEKDEKNNNCFDNLAFYDSVSVIAGRAIVTIEPIEEKPITQQPTKRLRFFEAEETPVQVKIQEVKEEAKQIEVKAAEEPKADKQSKLETLKIDGVEVRRKSLKDRRLSKSLYLKIDQPKEIPIIRQQSMPKFYLDTPDDQASTSMFRTPSAALASPVPKSSAFVYDLYSVVQMERQRVQTVETPVHRKELDRNSRILQIRDKIKLRRVKSSSGMPVTNLPHSHQHI